MPSSAADVLTKATLSATDLLGLNHAALARIVGLNESQVSRLARGEKSLEAGTKPAELATLLLRVHRSLDALVGHDDSRRKAWMASFNRAFNETPKDAIQKADGLVRVVSYLDGARSLA